MRPLTCTLTPLILALALGCSGGGTAADGGADAAQPDLGKPDAAQPDLGKPDAAQPDLDKPDAAQPDQLTPDASPPDAAPKPDSAPPVKQAWVAMGPPITGGYFVSSLVVDKTDVYASVTPGNKVSVRTLKGLKGTWAVVPGLQIPSKSTRVPMTLYKGAVVLGMPHGISSLDAKIFRKAAGATSFTVQPIGFLKNLPGIAELISTSASLYGVSYKGAITQTLINSADGKTFTISKLAGHYASANSRGFASGSRLFFYGDGVLRYSDDGGATCTTVSKGITAGAYAGAGDGKNVVAQTGAGQLQVAYSTDNGATFSVTKPAIVGSGPHAMVAADGCFVMTNKLHMLRSCDGGATWSAIDTGAPKVGLFISNPPQALAASQGYVYGFFGTQLYRHPAK